MRTLFLSMVLAAGFAAYPLRAHAEQLSTCSAAATSLVPVTGSSAMLYAFHLTSSRAQNISGDVAVDTSRGWFSVPLHNVKTEKIDGGFGSPTLYARFSTPVHVANSWLAHVEQRQCYPPPLLASADHAWPYTPQPRSTIVEAVIMQPYGRTDCTEPFAPARALTVVEPDFDRRNATFAGTAVIYVTVGIDGKPLEAAIGQSSHTAAFDDAARDAALKSTYSPAVAYCLPTISRYVYKAALTP